MGGETVLRSLIVNADDFGISDGVNEGILRAHREGIVTSASLMVRWPTARSAVALCASSSELSLGLHVDLGEWVFQEGRWQALYEVVPLERTDAVAAEVARQIDTFRQLTGADPTHLDSHQHVHRKERIFPILHEWSERLSVPLRHYDPRIQFCGAFYGQSGKGNASPAGITVEALLRILRSLPEGTTELGCHPGFGEDLETMYRAERRTEVETLCDPRVRAAIRELGLTLHSFAELPALANSEETLT